MAEGNHRTYDAIKRVLDVLGALTFLVLLSPIILLTALSVRLRLGSPVLFAQSRPGQGGRVFRLYKFRSMRNVDEARRLVTDEQRLTRFGQFLRSTSLDELPSLWNVLRGDMSFVGPRPLLVEYLEHYSLTQARRHEVRPGITGLAQVNGRNHVAWSERLSLDVTYVDNRGFVMDARILLATVRTVSTREGVSQDGHATMSRFGGADG